MFLSRTVQPGTFMFTDEHRSYTVLSEQYEHVTVSHSIGELRQRAGACQQRGIVLVHVQPRHATAPCTK